MKELRFSVPLLLCVLVHLSPALGCEMSTYDDQNVVLSGDGAGKYLAESMPVSSREACWEQCCSNSDCDMARVGRPIDGPWLCDLLKCDNDCVRTNNGQFRVYERKDVKTVLLTEEEERRNYERIAMCSLEKIVGNCRASFPRFYHNMATGTCQKFIYGGCGGNANNFKTIEECEAACSGVTDTVSSPKRANKESRDVPVTTVEVDTAADAQVKGMSADEYYQYCEVEPEVGLCKAAFTKWYYNSRTGECEQFTYGGCQGNKNNYASKESCESTCSGSANPSFKKSDDDTAEYEEKCMVSPEVGPCRAAFLSFYFDYQSGTCQTFLYGGCQGNGNRYNSMEECMSQCRLDGPFFRHNQARSRWTAAFFLFVTLAAISGLMLLALILISLRRRRVSRRSSLSDKEELLPDEQSSVESLSIPPSPQI